MSAFTDWRDGVINKVTSAPSAAAAATGSFIAEALGGSPAQDPAPVPMVLAPQPAAGILSSPNAARNLTYAAIGLVILFIVLRKVR